jgi:DNA-binding CsgD family transcriptional regulator/tetratricopeptide (TPR) repeat protein
VLPVEAPPELVGRLSELLKAQKVLEKAARAGAAPAIIRLAGEPGIGKTLFVQHLTAIARESGWLTLHTACHELQRNTPFITTTRLLLSVLQQLPDAGRYASGLEAELASLDPAVALRLAREPSPAPSKARYQEAFLRFLEGLGNDHNILILCDDAQWMDADSRDVLDTLLANYAVGPFTLLLAERKQAEADSRTGMATIALERLDTRASAKLAQSRYPDLSAVAIEAAVQHGNGNPFEVLTLCEELSQGHTVSESAADDAVRDLIATRVRTMAPADQEFLQACSLLGEPIEYRMLFSLYSPNEVALLASGTARPYLMAEGGAFRFRHGRIAEAIRSTVDFDVPLRQRIIAALEGLKDKTFADYERIAEHAKAIGDTDKAFEAYFALAKQAFTNKSWRAAIAAIESAAAVRDVDEKRFVEFYALYARALRTNSAVEKALSVLDTAIRRARFLGISSGVGILLAILMSTYWGKGRTAEALDAYRMHRPLLNSPRDRADAAASAMNIAAFSLDREGFAEAERRLAETGDSGSSYAPATAHSARAVMLSSMGKPAEALEEADRGVAAADTKFYQDELKSFVRMLVLFRSKGCAPIRAELDAWLERNKTEDRLNGTGAAFQAWIAMATGDWRLARAVAERSLLDDPSHTERIQLLAVPAMIACLTGKTAEFEPHGDAIARELAGTASRDTLLQLAPWSLMIKRDRDLEARLEEQVIGLPERPPTIRAFAFVPFGIAMLAQKLGKQSWLRVFTDSQNERDRCAWSLMQWRLARGVALRARKDGSSRDALSEACKEARALGAGFFAGYAAFLAGIQSSEDRRLLEQLGLGETYSSKGKTPLSRREMEVAALVGDGKTNRAIAEELFLSERTVERHLGNIFDKLQVDSRVQLTRWLFENAI